MVSGAVKVINSCLNIFNFFIKDFEFVTVRVVLPFLLQLIIHFFHLLLKISQIFVQNGLKLFFDLIQGSFLEIWSTILITWGLFLIKQIGHDNILFIFAVNYFFLELFVYFVLVRMFILEFFNHVAVNFNTSHEAVIDSKVYSIIFAEHVVKHDIVTFLQSKNTIFGYVYFLLPCFLEKKNSQIIIFFVYLQEKSLKNVLEQSPLLFYLSRISENLAQMAWSQFLWILWLVVLKN